jgi:hypothetical protein
MSQQLLYYPPVLSQYIINVPHQRRYIAVQTIVVVITA